MVVTSSDNTIVIAGKNQWCILRLEDNINKLDVSMMFGNPEAGSMSIQSTINQQDAKELAEWILHWLSFFEDKHDE